MPKPTFWPWKRIRGGGWRGVEIRPMARALGMAGSMWLGSPRIQAGDVHIGQLLYKGTLWGMNICLTYRVKAARQYIKGKGLVGRKGRAAKGPQAKGEVFRKAA